jgi:hypothetical protein
VCDEHNQHISTSTHHQSQGRSSWWADSSHLHAQKTSS